MEQPSALAVSLYEIVSGILGYVDSRRDLLSAIQCCRLWRDIGTSILWSHLDLDTAIPAKTIPIRRSQYFMNEPVPDSTYLASLCDPADTRRLQRLILTIQANPGYLNHVSRLTVRFNYQLSLSIPTPMRSNDHYLEFEEEDLPESVKQLCWSCCWQRIAMIIQICDLLTSRAWKSKCSTTGPNRLTIVLNIDLPRRSYDERLAIYTVFQTLSESFQFGPFARRPSPSLPDSSAIPMALTKGSLVLSESMALHDPRFLIPFFTFDDTPAPGGALVDTDESSLVHSRTCCFDELHLWNGTLFAPTTLAYILKGLGPLSVLRLERCTLTPEALDLLLQRSHTITSLFWSHTVFPPDTPMFSSVLSRFTRLSALSLRSCVRTWSPPITDVCTLVPAVGKGLVVLDVSQCFRLGSEFFLSVSDVCPNLQDLNLKGNMIKPDEITRILEHCPRLRRLDLADCPYVSITILESLVRLRPRSLQHLDLSGCSKVVENGSRACVLISVATHCLPLRTLQVGPIRTVDSLRDWRVLASLNGILTDRFSQGRSCLSRDEASDLSRINPAEHLQPPSEDDPQRYVHYLLALTMDRYVSFDMDILRNLTSHIENLKHSALEHNVLNERVATLEDLYQRSLDLRPPEPAPVDRYMATDVAATGCPVKLLAQQS
ncbi:uncharacterized protein BJ171DRAFT_636264 [Polychytrium aggregatum]|uniref:uncharacterized protein n=1 Tax=Polychytrium aggregatum TaxID=110093 RepID=UPI0022FDEFFD|nr:uncharacterized protein BJ171DRAFT_636264 [Polychytrium aggregatum]KAI9207877.1 hypothetical protein BJ171DRAFT_636264 [Polychytrium aggregatum]